MLQLTIPDSEYFNEQTNEFVQIQGRTIQLEHSLLSLSKWEAKWQKPFLRETPEKTEEEIIDYVRCMTLTQNVDPSVYFNLSDENVEDINAYISSPMTATWFNDRDNKINREIITSEIIYYQMIALNIPFECQKWHLNRLLTLIRVCSIKNAPQKKMSKRDVLRNNRELNAARKAKARGR